MKTLVFMGSSCLYERNSIMIMLRLVRFQVS